LIEIVGRNAELATCASVLEQIAAGSSCGLLIRGEPGIGKTTLYRAVLEDAVGGSYRVLADRPAEAEAQLSYVARRGSWRTRSVGSKCSESDSSFRCAAAAMKEPRSTVSP
jgi:Cdc6-like AAA superfamily ATPase